MTEEDIVALLAAVRCAGVRLTSGDVSSRKKKRMAKKVETCLTQKDSCTGLGADLTAVPEERLKRKMDNV